MHKHKTILKQSNKLIKASNTSRDVTKCLLCVEKSCLCSVRRSQATKFAMKRVRGLSSLWFAKSMDELAQKCNSFHDVVWLSHAAFPVFLYLKHFRHRMKTTPWEVWWRLILLIWLWLSVTPFVSCFAFVSFCSLSNQALSFTFHLCIQFIQFILYPSPSRFQKFKAKGNEVCFVCFVKFSKISASDSKTLCRDGFGRRMSPPMLKQCVKLCRSGGGSGRQGRQGRQRLFCDIFCTESSLKSMNITCTHRIRTYHSIPETNVHYEAPKQFWRLECSRLSGKSVDCVGSSLIPEDPEGFPQEIATRNFAAQYVCFLGLILMRVMGSQARRSDAGKVQIDVTKWCKSWSKWWGDWHISSDVPKSSCKRILISLEEVNTGVLKRGSSKQLDISMKLLSMDLRYFPPHTMDYWPLRQWSQSLCDLPRDQSKKEHWTSSWG